MLATRPDPRCAPRPPRSGLAAAVCLALALAIGGCDSSGSTGVDSATSPGDEPTSSEVFCGIPTDDLFFIVGPDAIPALTNPELVSPDHEDASYLSDDDRVVGLLVDGAPLAMPLNVLRWHENVNIDFEGERLAVSYCPLTGTALTFDRSVLDGAELGVSGLLFRNNLVLFDRGSEDRSFFPQMMRSAQCGPLARLGVQLPMVASWEMRWDAWRRLFPDSPVLSRRTGFDRPYTTNPNIDYEQIDNPRTLFPLTHDPRRPPKERVLGIPAGGDGGPVLPFGELARWERLAIPLRGGNSGIVVFWDGEAEAALAFSSWVDGESLTFTATPTGYVDDETGSTWRLDGLAVSGPMTGRRLMPIAESYVAFWFAWADMHPETVIWTSP